MCPVYIVGGSHMHVFLDAISSWHAFKSTVRYILRAPLSFSSFARLCKHTSLAAPN